MEFVETAERGYDSIATSGKAISWAEMRLHLERRAAGEGITHPKARRSAQ